MDWRKEAACIDTDPNDFFPERGDSFTKETQMAVSKCKKCPVRAQCLMHALNEPEQFGIWGGLSNRARMRISKTVQLPVNLEQTKWIIRKYDKAI